MMIWIWSVRKDDDLYKFSMPRSLLEVVLSLFFLVALAYAGWELGGSQ